MNRNPLTTFLSLRSAVAAEAIGDGGPDTCAALTGALDAGIEQCKGLILLPEPTRREVARIHRRASVGFSVGVGVKAGPSLTRGSAVPKTI